MIHTRHATLIHFKQSKLSDEYIIDQQKRGLGFSNVCAKLFSPFHISPKSIKTCSIMQMSFLRETHLKIHLLPSSCPPLFKKSVGHHTKVRLKNYVH